jgi:hypothetical protein
VRKFTKKQISYIFGAALFIILLVLPIKINNPINSEAKIIPAR